MMMMIRRTAGKTKLKDHFEGLRLASAHQPRHAARLTALPYHYGR